jgi:DNA-binding NarL/FixJ family response regulator
MVLKPMKIHIIENDPYYSDFLNKALLINPNNQIKLFASGEEYLKVTHGNKLPEVVIIDYKLPGITGLKVYEQLKSRITELNKVILLSSTEDGNVVLDFIQQGVKNHVIKDENIFDSLMSILDGMQDDYSKY